MLLLSPLLDLRVCVCMELSSSFFPPFLFFLSFPSPFSSHTSPAELAAHISLREALGNNTGSTGWGFGVVFLGALPKMEGWGGGEMPKSSSSHPWNTGSITRSL